MESKRDVKNFPAFPLLAASAYGMGDVLVAASNRAKLRPPAGMVPAPESRAKRLAAEDEAPRAMDRPNFSENNPVPAPIAAPNYETFLLIPNTHRLSRVIWRKPPLRRFFKKMAKIGPGKLKNRISPATFPL
jgi:hypothetical protein